MSRPAKQGKLIISADNYSKLSEGKFIYNGLFGKVCKIKDLVTTKEVIGQEVSISGDDSRQEALRKKIIQTALIKYEFLTRIIGVTNKKPMLLVTQSDKGKILFNVFKDQENNQKWLKNNTRRTIIALCIAKAMSVLHENDVVHGCLSPKNVLIERVDESEGKFFYPRIFDYGLAEFSGNSPERIVAPEIREDENMEYSKACDVFAFGVLLCELEKIKVWRALDKLPHIPSSFPKNLQIMIKDCWNDDPDKRPTFAEIYESFAKHNLEFSDSDRTKIDFVVEKIRLLDEKRAHAKYKPLRVIQKRQKFLDDLAKFYEELNSNPRTMSCFATGFFNVIGLHFNLETSQSIFKALLLVSQKLVQKREFCESFVAAKLHNNLPFDKPPLANIAFCIVYWINEHTPEAIQDIAKILAYFMTIPEYTYRVLVIFDRYVRKFHKIQFPWCFTDAVLVALQKKKELKHQDLLISMFYYLCKYHPVYRKERLEVCGKTIASLINSETNSVVRAVYAFFSEFRDIEITNKNFYKPLPKHLVNPHTAEAAVTFLLIKDNFVENAILDANLVNSILRLSTKSHKANLLLCKLAEYEEGAKLLMKQPKFIEAALPDYAGTFRVLLILLQTQEYRAHYQQSEELPFLLAAASTNADKTMVKCIQNLILYIDCSGNFIDELEENFFCENLYNSVCKLRDTELMRENYGVFMKFALENQALDFYIELIKKTKEQLEVTRKFDRESLELFTVLSTFQSCIEQFADFNPDQVFSKLVLKEEKYKKNVQIINQNAQAYLSKNLKASKEEKGLRNLARSQSIPKTAKPSKKSSQKLSDFSKTQTIQFPLKKD